jgi:hypothetical protein
MKKFVDQYISCCSKHFDTDDDNSGDASPISHEMSYNELKNSIYFGYDIFISYFFPSS